MKIAKLSLSLVVLQIALLLTWVVAGPVQAAGRNASLVDLLNSVSGDKLVEQLAAVSQFSRCVTDRGHDQAATYIANRLTQLGLTVEIQKFTSSAEGLRNGTQLQNIIARKPGSNPKAKHLLTAHFDSSPMRLFPPQCNELAPGANDNGSGVAALLEIARVLNGYQFQDDLELVFFDGEEFGYLGSYHYVTEYLNGPANQETIGTVVNLDMVGYPLDGTTNQTIYTISQPGASYDLAKAGAGLVADYLPGVKYQAYKIGDYFTPSRDPNRLSDQSSFWSAGLGTVVFINEDARDIVSGDPRYHSPGDKLYQADGSLRLDPVMMAAATRSALLLAVSKAGILSHRIFPALDPLFEKNWSGADHPLYSGQGAGRGYTWGPAPNATAVEDYAEAPGGQRKVAYFDKVRMELTNPSTGYVTNGLLVVELTTGRLQLGDNKFRQYAPSLVQVAGDPNSLPGSNDISPTYASFKAVVQRGKTGADTGQVSATLDKTGNEGKNPALANYARNVFYVPETGHNIPDIFFNWMQTSGPVYDPATDTFSTGKVIDWVPTMGLPVSDAYWVRAKVAGVEKDVLVQLYERRVLTFTPSNPPAFQVEMGNVGQHYYRWRNSL